MKIHHHPSKSNDPKHGDKTKDDGNDGPFVPLEPSKDGAHDNSEGIGSDCSKK